MKDSEFADCVGLRATRKLSASSRKVPFLVTSIELPELREAAQGLCDAVSSSPGLQRPKTEEFGFELSNLCITKEDLVEVFCNKFKAEILKAYDLANEHSALVRDNQVTDRTYPIPAQQQLHTSNGSPSTLIQRPVRFVSHPNRP